MNKIGIALKEWLEKENMTQRQLADSLGVTPQYINGIFSGRKPIGKKNAKKLANLSGLSESFLLTGEDETGTAAQTPAHIDKNEEVNRILRIYQEEIDDLKLYHQRECDAYKATIDSQKETIMLLKEKIADLTSEINQLKSADTLQKYPFSPGVADHKKDQTDTL